MKSETLKPAQSLQAARAVTQEILINTNCLWREMTMKSKPNPEYVEKTVSQLREAIENFNRLLPR